MAELTHFDACGNAVMVDIGGKEHTERQATAIGTICMSRKSYEAVRNQAAPKGDVLSVARIAGIMAVKQTSTLIPLCHPLPVESASIVFDLSDEDCRICVTCTVKTTGATGVEIEALLGVNVTLLTIYDMCKAIDKSMVMERICLLEKKGGKSGAYRRTNEDNDGAM